MAETNYRTEVAEYRKRPISVTARQTDKPFDIETLEGTMHAEAGDYIVTGMKGEQYPVKPDVFARTYEPVLDIDERRAAAKEESGRQQLRRNTFHAARDVCDDAHADLLTLLGSMGNWMMMGKPLPGQDPAEMLDPMVFEIQNRVYDAVGAIARLREYASDKLNRDRNW